MSKTFGDSDGAQANATCAGAHRNRSATATTAGPFRTEPGPTAPEPSGENGTNAPVTGALVQRWLGYAVRGVNAF